MKPMASRFTTWLRRGLALLALTAPPLLAAAPAGAQTSCTASATLFCVSDETSLRTALTDAVSGDTISFTGNVSLNPTSGLNDLSAITTNLTILGNGYTLNGSSTFRGLFVYSGNVSISDLTITGATATGGAGGNGLLAGGGGAGLGGGLFVGSTAQVVLNNVQVTTNAAMGGGGGLVDTGYPGTGGGGGLGGSGGRVANYINGGGGGIGRGASGGADSGIGSSGIVAGGGAGGSSDTGVAGGANGGGGGSGSAAGGGDSMVEVE